MALRIFTNVNALVSSTRLGFNNDKLADSLQRIASGQRLLRSADDAASLSISEVLRSDVITLKQGVKNINDALSLVKTADGGLGVISGILIRLRELAEQGASGTLDSTGRATIQLEFSSLRSELDRIAKTNSFKNINLLDGTLAADSDQLVVIQVGLESKDPDRVNVNQEVDLDSVTSLELGLDALSLSTQEGAVSALDAIENINRGISDRRGRVGSLLNGLTQSRNNLQVSIENLTASESTLRDADMAEEFTTLTRNQLLVQSAAAMVGQSNLLPEGVLQLLDFT